MQQQQQPVPIFNEIKREKDVENNNGKLDISCAKMQWYENEIKYFSDCINMPERYKSRDESLIAFFPLFLFCAQHTYALDARGTISLCVQFVLRSSFSLFRFVRFSFYQHIWCV